MKAYHQIAMGILAGILCTTGLFIWTGCDTAGATDSLTLSPSAATLGAGESQEFIAGGGYEYTWTILNSTSSSSTGSVSSGAGSLSSRTGKTVIYTAPSGVTSANSPVTLHVTSTIQGSGAGTTNTSAYSVSADALISFK